MMVVSGDGVKDGDGGWLAEMVWVTAMVVGFGDGVSERDGGWMRGWWLASGMG